MSSLYVKIFKKLNNYNLEIEFETSSKVIAFFGGTGSGKSMTLKCISGIEKPDEGKIIYDNEVLFDSSKKINLIPQKRNIAYLFQSYALFPNMTVEKNVICSIKEKDKKLKNEIALQVLEKMNIDKLKNQLPYSLSGGEKQRVALARILVSNPNMLLLDEPFSAVDAYTKYSLYKMLKEIINSFTKNVILVSHSREEVYYFADEIFIFNNGKIIESGSREDIFNNAKEKWTKILIHDYMKDLEEI